MNPPPAAPPAVTLPSRRQAAVSLGLLLAINLINYIDRYLLAAIESQVRQDLLPDDPNALTKMGSLAMWFLVSYMLAAPIFGWLADRMSRWTIIGVGVLLWTIATGASGLASTFVFLLICRVFVGVGEGAWGPAAPSVIADMYPPERRGAVLSWFYVAIPVGSALGYVIGGAVASAISWHWAFFVVTPPGIILGIWALTRRDPVRGGQDRSGPPRKLTINDLRLLLRNRSYVINTIGQTFQTFAIGGMSFWAPTYVHEFRLHGLPTDKEQLGQVTFLFGVITASAGLAGTLVGGYASDWLRPYIRGSYFAFSGATMILAFPLFLLVLLLPFPWAWVMMFLCIFCLFMNTGPTNAITVNVTSPSVRATAFSLGILVMHALGDAISPPLIGFIADQTNRNMNLAFGVVGVAILLAGVAWMLGARYLDADVARASSPDVVPRPG